MQQEVGLHFLAFIALAVHIVLFVELSPIQKHPISRFNHLLVSFISATGATFMMHLNWGASSNIDWFVGLLASFILCIFLTLNIQRFLRI